MSETETVEVELPVTLIDTVDGYCEDRGHINRGGLIRASVRVQVQDCGTMPVPDGLAELEELIQELSSVVKAIEYRWSSDLATRRRTGPRFAVAFR